VLTGGVPHIVFLCVANSARSQIAEGYARTYLAGRATVASAGTRPLHVNPYAVTVMSEHGLDLRAHHAKSADALVAADIDLLVMVCEDEICPSHLAKLPRRHWNVADPASDDPRITHDEMLARFRRARDTIWRHVLDLGHELHAGRARSG
jgi:arsenate reductase